MKDINKDTFREYIKNLPPTKKELGQAWSAAIGLQAVDGLSPSSYLFEVVKKNIEGEITMDEAQALIDSYHESGDRNLLEHDDSHNAPEKSNQDDMTKQILQLLRKDPGITRAKMKEALGCSDYMIKRKFEELVKCNIIRRRGSNRKGTWVIMDELLEAEPVVIDRQRAEQILREKLADNLVIVASFEDADAWCFDLGLVTDNGDIRPLMGNSVIRISKETGEIE